MEVISRRLDYLMEWVTTGDLVRKITMRGLGRKIRNRLRATARKNSKALIVAGLALFAIILTGTGVTYKNYMTSNIDPAKYTPLLDTIAKGESKGNYNAYFGNSTNTDIRFTEMTVAEVLKWQDDYVAGGSPSSAVGKYQILNTTLRGLVQQLGIDTSMKYDEKLQDRLAVALLERRGAQDYVAKKLTREQFAANIAKEWAALPKATHPNPEQSYYAHDGLNKVQVSLDEIYKALAVLNT